MHYIVQILVGLTVGLLTDLIRWIVRRVRKGSNRSAR
jgi:hypothetical protein